jgi:serine protease Do
VSRFFDAFSLYTVVIIKSRLFFSLLLLSFTGSFFCFAPAWAQSISADQVFSSLERSVFQIRIMEEKSGSQVALGTGFLVADERLATNYHVVSSAVLEPTKYRIEIDWQEQPLELAVIRVDVVNDLALLRLPNPLENAPSIFQLARSKPKKGELLYSLGNPHDLGMTIVEGNYNGLVDNKYLDRIHFSGAINSGMSGGPTVNRQSQVVGINVASAGNQVGFLVPVQALARLLENGEEAQGESAILASMAVQIAVVTDGMLQAMLDAKWPREEMGQALILGELVNWFDCWGNSDFDKETGTLEIARGCNSADSIFVSDRLSSGFMEYEFYYFESEEWHPAAFYRHLRANTSSAKPGNKGSKEDMENFSCADQILATDNADNQNPMRRRVSYCTRPYKKLPGLYDVFFIGVTMDRNNRAVMDHYTLAGVTPALSQKFLEKFIGVLAWR